MSMLWKRRILGAFVILDLVFLVVSMISWNLYLSVCCFILAICLTRFFKDAGLVKFYTGRQIRKELNGKRAEEKRQVAR